jgi:hypothetical protein
VETVILQMVLKTLLLTGCKQKAIGKIKRGSVSSISTNFA